MKKILTLLVLASFAITLHAEQLSPSDLVQMTALKKGVDDADAAYRSNSSSSERSKFYKAYHEMEQTNVPQLFSLAQKDPESKPAFDVFLWIAMDRLAVSTAFRSYQIQSLEYLTKYHSTNSMLGPLCSALGSYWVEWWREPFVDMIKSLAKDSPNPATRDRATNELSRLNANKSKQPVVEFLKSVVKNNSDRAIRAQAIYALGRLDADKSEELALFEKVPFCSKNMTTNALAEWKAFGSSQQAAADAESSFNEVIANYPDCLDLGELSSPKKEAPRLKELAERQLFALKHLSLGKEAPEIEAEGVDGKKFKLSDSRGKICVLTFWASWCGPCMEMVPVERALAERMQGKPFSLVGVNGDLSLTNAKRAIEREHMTWPSFWNGKEGSGGPIAKAWNLDGWPTIYVMDAQGIIRFKGEAALQDINGCVDALMKELTVKNP
jgi:thiol-disulfide isomerase/thioredoxin